MQKAGAQQRVRNRFQGAVGVLRERGMLSRSAGQTQFSDGLQAILKRMGENVSQQGQIETNKMQRCLTGRFVDDGSGSEAVVSASGVYGNPMLENAINYKNLEECADFSFDDFYFLPDDDGGTPDQAECDTSKLDAYLFGESEQPAEGQTRARSRTIAPQPVSEHMQTHQNPVGFLEWETVERAAGNGLAREGGGGVYQWSTKAFVAMPMVHYFNPSKKKLLMGTKPAKYKDAMLCWNPGSGKPDVISIRMEYSGLHFDLAGEAQPLVIPYDCIMHTRSTLTRSGSDSWPHVDLFCAGRPIDKNRLGEWSFRDIDPGEATVVRVFMAYSNMAIAFARGFHTSMQKLLRDADNTSLSHIGRFTIKQYAAQFIAAFDTPGTLMSRIMDCPFDGKPQKRSFF